MLTIGSKLGPYEIQSPIGAGGMGEVYRARDTRLGRDVAIKILPQHLTEKADARQRFEREARAVSSLNHPHICTLYDIGHQDGTDFLVMELLDGETLAKRLEKGPLATAELLRIGIEIADALDKAHRQGILHRDLKPSNIMLMKTGAKLMDFGLAKASEAGSPMPSSLTQSLNPSAKTTPVTAEGTIVGTFQYMSPEQMEGKEADARSDIFSFGAVLFEMATGKRAFEGKTTASVIAAILEREPPPISSVQPMSPPALDRTVRICLAKDPDERFQSAHDVKLQLEWIRDAGSQAGIAAPIVAHRKNRERLAWMAVALLTIIAALLAYGFIARAPKPMPAYVSELPPPANASYALVGFSAGPPVLSPDGLRIAFCANGTDGRRLLWVRSFSVPAGRPLEGTDGASFPFWSPDGRSIGFFAQGELKRIDASGGPALPIAGAPFGRGGSWGRDGTILFVPDQIGGIFRVAASGGTPRAVTKPNESLKQVYHRWPQFLPDGKHFLFLALSTAGELSGTYAASLDGGDPKLILRGAWNAIYAPPGYLLFVRQGALMAQRFDASRLELEGQAVPIGENVGEDRTSTVNREILDASTNGVLVYAEGGGTGGGGSLLAWFDRSGQRVRETGGPGEYATVAVSPDGTKLAVGMLQPDGVGVFDLARGTRTRVTFSNATNGQPAWSPDGKYIAFFSNRSMLSHIYQRAANGTGATTPLVVDDALETYPSWSPDDRYLIFNRQAAQPNSNIEIWAMPLFGDRNAFPVVRGAFNATWPAVSPDGRWLAYTSDESGREEVYVVSFLHGSGKWLVSTQGGNRPRWRRDGKELFYLSPDNKIMAAEILAQGTGFAVGEVQPLFQTSLALNPGWLFDVSADGKEFVVVSLATEPSAGQLTLVVNWPALLKKQ
ncbi:MAG TPA: protein kinase [Candidatus Dormibacteraeota bacterium]|nr:protein kinase [Candidatus Dormibacteraeota bacterium]